MRDQLILLGYTVLWRNELGPACTVEYFVESREVDIIESIPGAQIKAARWSCKSVGTGAMIFTYPILRNWCLLEVYWFLLLRTNLLLVALVL